MEGRFWCPARTPFYYLYFYLYLSIIYTFILFILFLRGGSRVVKVWRGGFGASQDTFLLFILATHAIALGETNISFNNP